MSKIFRLLHVLNILSIDIAAGAVLSCAFFARLFEVSLLVYGYVTLGLTVWIIYTADHLLDVWKNPHPASTQRHRFHQKYFTVLAIVLVIALVIVGIQISFIRKPILISGIGLSTLVAVYFISQRKLSFLKELFAALLYTGGVLIAPVSLLHVSLPSYKIVLVVQFFLTALANLLLFSLFDVKNDSKDSFPSFTISFGERLTFIFLLAVLGINAVITIWQFIEVGYISTPLVILLVMNALLGLILLKRKYFEVEDRYRLMGDAVFLLPLFYLFTGNA